MDSFNLTFKQVVPIIKAVLVFVGPFILLYAGLSTLLSYLLIANSRSSTLSFLDGYLSPFAGSFLLGLAFSILIGNMFYLSINCYFLRYGEGADGRVKRNDIWADIKKYFWSSLGIIVIRVGVLVLIFIGLRALDYSVLTLILGIVLSVYFWVATSLAIPIKINEGGTIIHALTHSILLVTANWWETVGLNLALGIVLFFLCLFAGIITMMFFRLLGILFSSDLGFTTIGIMINVFFISVITSIMGACSLSTLLAGSLLQYFNLSEARPRFSTTEDLIDQIGRTSPQ